MKSEELILEDGEGIIDVIGGEFDHLLSIRGEPTQMHWCDCQGSVGQYLSRSKGLNLEDEYKSIKSVIDGAFNPEGNYFDQLYPLLKLFTSGAYLLSFTEEKAEHPYYNEGGKIENFYPYEEPLIASRAKGELSNERIEYFEREIIRGEKPLVIVACALDSYCRFIIDGHHKLEAHIKLKSKVRILTIMKNEHSEVRKEDGLRVLSGESKYIKHYKAEKPRYN